MSVFGFRTQYGGGKSTGFALLYDSAEAMKNFEPRYRLIRYGQATKIERASRQQRECTLHVRWNETNTVSFANMDTTRSLCCDEKEYNTDAVVAYRQAEKEPLQGVPRYGQDQGCREEGQEIDGRRCACVYAAAGGIGCGCDESSYCLHDLVRRQHRLGVHDDAEGLVISRAMKDSIPTDLKLTNVDIFFSADSPTFLFEHWPREPLSTNLIHVLVATEFVCSRVLETIKQQVHVSRLCSTVEMIFTAAFFSVFNSQEWFIAPCRRLDSQRWASKVPTALQTSRRATQMTS